jgi:hypothetical protein
MRHLLQCLPQQYCPYLLPLFGEMQALTRAAKVTHQGCNSRDQIDLSQQPFGHRQGPTEATLRRKVTVAHRGHREEAEVRVVASRPRLLRGEEGLRSKIPDGLEHEGEGQTKQDVNSHGPQDREHAYLCMPPDPVSNRAGCRQRQEQARNREIPAGGPRLLRDSDKDADADTKHGDPQPCSHYFPPHA